MKPPAKLKTWSPEEHERYERLWREEQAAFAQDLAFKTPELPTPEAFSDFREWRFQVKEMPLMEMHAEYVRKHYKGRKAATGTTAPPPPQGGAAQA
ncbi:MAG: hypothetical protein H7A55_08270 [Verrucomicrobiaceae bacterium]|nr:hypothetical protein [Verrucomicrobiaceae bacterium]